MASCHDPQIGALLHLYELGNLTEKERDEFEVHLLKCHYCFEKVEAFKTEAELMRNSGDIRDILLVPETTETESGFWKSLWPKKPLLLKPGFGLLLVLLLIFPSIIGIYSLLDNHQGIRQIQMVSITSSRAANNKVFYKSQGTEGVINLAVGGLSGEKSYIVEIRRCNSDKALYSYEGIVFNELGMGQLYLPLAEMPVGDYTLVVINGANDSKDKLSYTFSIKE
ncbi:MAG: zf-HC2 domain-containing protein [Candidatus Zixiibacteriota bacterium]